MGGGGKNWMDLFSYIYKNGYAKVGWYYTIPIK